MPSDLVDMRGKGFAIRRDVVLCVERVGGVTAAWSFHSGVEPSTHH